MSTLKIFKEEKPVQIYDFEHHFYAQELIDLLSTRTEYPFMDDALNMHLSKDVFVPFSQPSLNGNQNQLSSLIDINSGRIKIMDENELHCGVLSTGDSIELLPKDDAIAMARATNNKVAEAIKMHPGRFLGSICLPAPYVEDAIAELHRAVEDLGLTYWHTHSSFGVERISDDKYDPLLDECGKLGVPFYIHPCYPLTDYLAECGPFLLGAPFGFTVDVMKTALKLIAKGTFERNPNLKMILGHMAEFLPFTMARIDNMIELFPVLDPDGTLDPSFNAKHTIKEYFERKNIFMTTSGIFDEEVIKFVIKTIGSDNILYGSDYPFEGLNHSMDFIKNLDINEEDKEKILYKNAEKYIFA